MVEVRGLYRLHSLHDGALQAKAQLWELGTHLGTLLGGHGFAHLRREGIEKPRKLEDEWPESIICQEFSAM